MNPEFARNLWLETTPRRIAWAAASVVLILFATAVVAGRVFADGVQPNRVGAVGVAGLLIFLAAAGAWGARDAGRAVRLEIGERTWDFQRLSALTPWSMTWGKLFGATSLAWLTAVIGLVAAGPVMARRLSAARFGEAVLGLVAFALLLQAANFAGSLVSVRKARAEGRLAVVRGGIGGFFSGLVVLFVIFQGLRLAFVVARGGEGGLNGWGLNTHFWWGLAVDSAGVIVLSLTIYAAWAVVGAWRLMRLELQMRNTPALWTTFLVFTALYLAGFAGLAGVEGRMAVMAGVFAAAAYAGAFIDPADRVGLRQFAASCREGDWRRALHRTPLALPAVVLALLSVVAFAFAYRGDFPGASPAFAFAALAFLLRDLGVIAYFRFGPRPRRGDLGAVLALFLLYAVGGAFGSLGGSGGKAIFTPSAAAPLVSMISALIQAAVIWWLASRRIREPETH